MTEFAIGSPVVIRHQRRGTIRSRTTDGQYVVVTEHGTLWIPQKELDHYNPVQGCDEPPPKFIFAAVWLDIANGILEQGKRMVDIREIVAESQLGIAA